MKNINSQFDNLLNHLFNSTEPQISSLKKHKHIQKSKKLIYNILNNIKQKNRKNIFIKLDNLSDEYLDYCNYTNKKYYKAGFKDCLCLILNSYYNK